ncbi:MAG TPA: ABC transporter permease [Patescibacteria group bacterium]|nr:ABC transporter permease [Patescibacteria group bacterium]
MNEELIHLIKTAFIDLNRSRIRTFLTALGILIGVMSVVMLIALGLGLKNYIEKQFESLGANLIMIMPGSGFGGQGGFGPGLVTGARFDEKDVNSLKRIPNVRYTVPLYFKSTKVDTGGEAKFGYLMGVNEDYFSLMNTQLLEGEIFSKSELQSRAKIAVLGEKIADELFDTPQDAVGKNIRFDEQRFKIIGVIKKSGDNEQDNSIIIPYKTTFGSINPDKTFWAIYLGVESEKDIEAVKAKAKEALTKRYEDDDFSVSEQSEILSTINQIFTIINSVLVAIGSISLIVGGIGIMNIMYASVTERTKEIGIRRAVGATEKDILLQFLTESVILSVFGGIMGLILSIIIVLGIRIFFPATINLLSVIITLVISTGIGIFFGVFPARRAAKLPPIEAIRYE